MVSEKNSADSGKGTPQKPALKRTKRKVYGERHIIGFLFAICFVLSLLLGGLLTSLVALRIPDISTVSHYRPAQTSTILDRHGKVVERVFRENRTVISLEQMPDLLPKAFVAAEDGRFYEHPGLDFFSVMRALYVNIRRGGKAHGGSTITQQVARSLLLSREKTYLRKFKEAILAWRIDSLLSKNEIIYIYLNQIYLGEGANGVEAAAQTYFGCHARDLRLGEMAVLAGLPQAPSKYSPTRNLELAVKRQRYVLNRMVDDGYITGEQAKKAFDEGLRLVHGDESGADADSGYFTALVKKRVQKMLDVPLATAGVTITTTLDLEMQKAAVAALRAGIQASHGRQVARGELETQRPQGAVVCLDACSGKIRALVGGERYQTSHYNRAVFARRQAGSAFKPVLYAAALEKGWHADSLILDAPLNISAGGGKIWSPKNYDNRYHGQVTLQQALTHSYNTAAVRLLQKTGIPTVQELAGKLGIDAREVNDLSLALGSLDVTLLNLTSAYTSFVCDGSVTAPRFIEKVVDVQGTVHVPERAVRSQAISRQAAAMMKVMLAGVISDGTGKRASGLPGASGGKTGTSNDQRDAWFIGYWNSLVAGVWIGNDKNESLGSGEGGGRAATPVWYNLMKNVSGQ